MGTMALRLGLAACVAAALGTAAVGQSSTASATIESFIAEIAKPPEVKPVRTPPWNAEGSGITPDTRATYGVLPNGLRYVIRKNDTPKERVMVRMRIDFGSAGEADNEQGLAHFVEHMAFNGTTRVPEGEMVKLLERKGLAFGPDTNASTGYLATTYMLDLPKPTDDLLNTAMFLMRETASEISFDPKAVDKERGVVLEEKRVRENFSFQASRAAQAFLRPDTYFSKRFPIGTEEVIKTAPAERLKALYRTWYRPERTVIVVVGPVDVAAVEARIARAFGDWKNDAPPPPPEKTVQDSCTINLRRGNEAEIFTHPQISESVGLLVHGKAPFTRDTQAARDYALLRDVGEAIFDRRVSRLIRKGDAPFLGINLDQSFPLCGVYSVLSFGVSAKDGQWQAALPAAEQLLRQALQYGFTQAELDEQKRELRLSFENAVKTESTQSSGSMVNSFLAQTSRYRGVVTSAATRLQQWNRIEKTLNVKRVNAAFRDVYGKFGRPLVFATAKPEHLKDQAALLAALNASRKVAVKPPAAQATTKFAYGNWGEPGRIVEDKMIADLDIRTIRFANGVMLNLKKTPYDANSIFVNVAVDGGDVLLGKDKTAYRYLGGSITAGGLGKHSVDELQSLTAGTTAGAGLGASLDRFTSGGRVTQEDLPLQMQLMAAYITDPGYREEALLRFKKTLPETYARLDATPGAALANRSAPILYGDDPRFTRPPIEVLQGLDFATYKAVNAQALATGAIEIGIVGDFDMDKTIAAVAQTFGALPQRAAAFVNRDKEIARGWSPKRGVFTISHQGEPDQLAWLRIWPTTDGRDLRRSLTHDILAEIISLRLIDELRENAGASYGASAGSSMSDDIAGFGSLYIATNGDVAKLALIDKIISDVVAEVRSKPADADLFERARKPTLELYSSWRQRNSTWIGLVASAQSDTKSLDDFRRSEEMFKSITPAEVLAEAQTWLKDDQAFTFHVKPAAVVARDAAGTAAAPAAKAAQ